MADIIAEFRAYFERPPLQLAGQVFRFAADEAELRDCLLTARVGGQVELCATGMVDAPWVRFRPIGSGRWECEIAIDARTAGGIAARHSRDAVLVVATSSARFPLATVRLSDILPSAITDSYLGQLAAGIDRNHWGIEAIFGHDEKYYAFGWALPPAGAAPGILLATIDGVPARVIQDLRSDVAMGLYWFMPDAPRYGFLLSGPMSGRDKFIEMAVRYDRDPPTNRRFPEYCYTGDFDAWNLPPDENIQRVAGPSANKVLYLNSGYTDCRHLITILREEWGPLTAGLRILDWGCGCARISRHLPDLLPQPKLTGIDIDAENIRWCTENLPQGRFSAVGLFPPTELPTSDFDIVISTSVITHLTPPAMTAWLAEIHRVLRPNGLALLSYHGNATSFRYAAHDPELVSSITGTGISAAHSCADLNGHISGPNYYRNTFMTDAHAREQFQKGFIVKAIVRGLVAGQQNVAVLRKAR